MREILSKLGFYEFDGAYRLDLENNNKLDLNFICFSEKRKLIEVKTYIRVYPEHSEKIILNYAHFESTLHCFENDFESVVIETIENTKKVFNFFESESKWEVK